MAITVTKVGYRDAYGGRFAQYADLTLPAAYAGSAGETLNPRDFGMSLQIDMLLGLSAPGVDLRWDPATAKVHAYRPGSAAGLAVDVKHASGAAAAGVAVYAHVDEVVEQGTALAHLEFVSPTTTDGSLTLFSGGPTLQIQHDAAAATGGTAVYIDEDGAAGARLLSNTGRSCWVQCSSGEFIKIKADATPATPGVLVYCDEDAANTYERLLFVSPTTTNGKATFVQANECPAGADLSLTTVRVLAVGI